MDYPLLLKIMCVLVLFVLLGWPFRRLIFGPTTREPAPVKPCEFCDSLGAVHAESCPRNETTLSGLRYAAQLYDQGYLAGRRGGMNPGHKDRYVCFGYAKGQAMRFRDD